MHSQEQSKQVSKDQSLIMEINFMFRIFNKGCRLISQHTHNYCHFGVTCNYKNIVRKSTKQNDNFLESDKDKVP